MTTRLLLLMSCFALLTLTMACADDNGDGSPGGPVVTGGGGGGGGGGGLSLRHDTPFSVEHEAALARLLLVWDLVPRRLNEVREFREGQLFDMVREAVGSAEGSEDCGGTGSVSVAPESLTLSNPFTGNEETFSGEVFTFTNCTFGELREMSITTDRRFDGTAVFLEAADGTAFTELSGPFRITRQGETLGMSYVDDRTSEMSYFELASSPGQRTVSMVGSWTSAGLEELGPVTNANRFHVEGFGGTGEAEDLRRHVTHPDMDEGSSPTERSMRVRVDARTNDNPEGRECTAWGRFDVETEQVAAELDGQVVGHYTVSRLTSADGVTATIQPAFEEVGNFLIPQGMEVTIGGEARVFQNQEQGAIRQDVERTCRPEFTGFGW